MTRYRIIIAVVLLLAFAPPAIARSQLGHTFTCKIGVGITLASHGEVHSGAGFSCTGSNIATGPVTLWTCGQQWVRQDRKFENVVCSERGPWTNFISYRTIGWTCRNVGGQVQTRAEDYAPELIPSRRSVTSVVRYCLP